VNKIDKSIRIPKERNSIITIVIIIVDKRLFLGRFIMINGG
jgi:hypothetical protein